MQQKLEKNYYEILGVSPDASRQEIEDAYESARKIYSEDSVAVYSLYTTEEKEALLEKITEAYETVKDRLKKRRYDDQLASSEYAEDSEIDINTLRNDTDIIENSVTQDIFHETDTHRSTVKFRQHIVTMDGKDTMTTEQYRILYANLEQISLENSYKTFAITSALKGEGKSITAINLSYMMATEFKKKVILVECDLRNPTITAYLQDISQTSPGLVDVLNRTVALEEAIRHLEGTSLYFLSERNSFKNSAELLGTQRLNVLLNRLKLDFDYIIIDCPPIIPIVDMQIISKQVDGVVLVVRAGKTPKDIVIKAVKSLKDANIVGTVLNCAEVSRHSYYYYD